MSARREILIVGAGPAGSALAIALARKGRDVVLIERQAEPRDKVCGEFLSGGALGMLERLGVDAVGLGAASIEETRLVRGRGRAVRRLPFPAASLSRRRLDEALIARAAEAGAEVRRGVAVRTLERLAAGWRARLADGAEIEADEAALATGKHDLRGFARPEGRQNDLIGFKRHLRLTPDQALALGPAVEIGLFPGGYAGLEPIEDGLANLCLLVRQDAYSALGRDWPALLAAIRRSAPAFGERLAGAEPAHGRPLACAGMPYGLRVRETGGVWRLGDQAAVIPSFAGEGVAIALRSARAAADALLAGRSADEFQRVFRVEIRRPVELASAVSRLIVRAPAQRAAFAAATFAPALLAALGRATRLRSA